MRNQREAPNRPFADVVAKAVGSSNPYNMVNATLEALKKMESPRQIAARRGKKVGDVVAGREGAKSEVAPAKSEEKA